MRLIAMTLLLTFLLAPPICIMAQSDLSADLVMSGQTDNGPRLALTYYDYPFYRFGDCNGDGWCSYGDLVTLIRTYQGWPPEACMPAGDINDDGEINILDIIDLIFWLREYPGNNPPANECSWEVPDAEIGGAICIDNCIGDPGETVYIGVYVQTSLMNCFHFSLAYDNEDIENIFFGDVNPIFYDVSWSDWAIIRENVPPGNDDTLNTVTLALFGGDEAGNIFSPIELPELTWAFDIGVTISPGSQGGYHPLLLEADPYFGPPMFHSEYGWDWYEFPAVTDNCIYIPGDCDHNGTALELVDVVAMVGMYRGTIEADYTCACGVRGCSFSPQADPNGNCISFELTDVVIEIGAYRNDPPGTVAQGCPDCPGSR